MSRFWLLVLAMDYNEPTRTTPHHTYLVRSCCTVMIGSREESFSTVSKCTVCPWVLKEVFWTLLAQPQQCSSWQVRLLSGVSGLTLSRNKALILRDKDGSKGSPQKSCVHRNVELESSGASFRMVVLTVTYAAWWQLHHPSSFHYKPLSGLVRWPAGGFLVTCHHDLGLSPETHVVEEGNWHPQVVSDFQTRHKYAPTRLHAHGLPQ